MGAKFLNLVVERHSHQLGCIVITIQRTQQPEGKWKYNLFLDGLDMEILPTIKSKVKKFDEAMKSLKTMQHQVFFDAISDMKYTTFKLRSTVTNS